MGASAKTLDWINLGTTMAGIYGGRALAIVARRRAPPQRPGGPLMNGHDAAPAQPAAAADPAGEAVDWSLMRGRAN